MNKADSGAIEERLARLERGVKRGKLATTAMMILLVTLIAWSVPARSEKAQAAGSGDEHLVARSLKIVDQKGNPCIVLAVDKEGPGVFLSDAKGHPRVVLAVTENGPT